MVVVLVRVPDIVEPDPAAAPPIFVFVTGVQLYVVPMGTITLGGLLTGFTTKVPPVQIAAVD